MINVSEMANAFTFSLFDNTTNNPTMFVVQVDAELSDAEVYDVVDRIKDSDYVQRITGATATLNGGVQVTRSASAVAP